MSAADRRARGVAEIERLITDLREASAKALSATDEDIAKFKMNPLSRHPMAFGILTAKTEHITIQLRAVVDVYLKPSKLDRRR